MQLTENALRLLLRRRHWQPHRTFTVEYDRAAAAIDQRLIGRGPSRVQLHRWLSGQLHGLPYPDHCRVLEAMFPGWSAAELFAPCSAEELRRRGGEQTASRDDGGAAANVASGADRMSDVTAVYATRGELISEMPPTSLFDGATRIRVAGLSLNLLCQYYPDQSLYRLLAAGTELRCLFLEPHGEAIRAREREEGHAPGHLSTLTELNINLVKRTRDRLPPASRSRVNVAVYDETIRHNIVLVDDDLCVAQPYLGDVRGLDSPTFVIERRWPDRGLFHVYEQSFQSLWQRGRAL